MAITCISLVLINIFHFACNEKKEINLRSFESVEVQGRMQYLETILTKAGVLFFSIENNNLCYINGEKIAIADSLDVVLKCTSKEADSVINNMKYLKGLNIDVIRMFRNETADGGKCPFWGYYYGGMTDCLPCDNIIVRLPVNFDDFDMPCIYRSFTLEGRYKNIILLHQGSSFDKKVL